MTRRELFELAGESALAGTFAMLPAEGEGAGTPQTASAAPAQLPGTEPLTLEGDMAAHMVEGMHHHLAALTAASPAARPSRWNPDTSSHTAYEKSMEPMRERLRQIIGAIDPRVPFSAPHLDFALGDSPEVALGDGYKVLSVRWPVLEGVEGEGLLLGPAGTPRACVVALPDADWTPEMLAGLAPGIPTEAQFARRLAEQGCMVLIPTLLDRSCTWSGNPQLHKLTNMPHREYIYRMAFENGRHIIGYEVQKVLAAVDWFAQSEPARPIGVMGYGEGGLLALHSAALDSRIGAACVSGYFQPRENVWQEPLYRNVWSLLEAYGDAELAGMIAPRTLVVEAARGPSDPPPVAASEHRIHAAATGHLTTPQVAEVRAEVQRAQPVFEKLNAADHLHLVATGGGQGLPGSAEALEKFLQGLGTTGHLKPSGRAPRDLRKAFDARVRLHHQVKQLVDFSQKAVIDAEGVRAKFWARADTSSLQKWQDSLDFYRQYYWEEIIGKLPAPSEPLAAQTRKIYDEITWTGYEVFLPLWPEVFAYGILLVPKSLRAGERRPVVVCQHGWHGRPQDLINPDTAKAEGYYRKYAAHLADHGFIVYCPQMPFIGEGYQILQRLANPLKLSAFSLMVSQHERTLDWLTQLPFVDERRIALYGLSYGGRAASRVPPLLPRYALSICAADFNENVRSVCSDQTNWGYLLGDTYSVLMFNMGNTYNYSELANMTLPRPFMVERGHDDPVSVDPWVSYEYAKVRYLYDKFELGERTRIEYFEGGHTIHGVGTFDFLYRFLDWSEPSH